MKGFGFVFNVNSGFDFQRTYREYGFGTEEGLKSAIDYNIGRCVTDVVCLHNCIVVKTGHLGTSSEILSSIKEGFGALSVVAAVFSPYIDNDAKGLVYNIYMAENLSKVKYPL